MREYRLRLSDAQIYASQCRLDFSQLVKNALPAELVDDPSAFGALAEAFDLPDKLAPRPLGRVLHGGLGARQNEARE